MLVAVIGTALATLGGWLPRVLGVPKLALGEVIEALLLTAQDVELVLAFLRLVHSSIEPSRLGFGGRCPPEQPLEESHPVDATPAGRCRLVRRIAFGATLGS